MEKRVLIDTNVLIASLLSGVGPNRKVVRLCLEGKLLPQVGFALFLEYEDVFARDELFDRTGLSKEQRTRFLDGFLSVCEWNEIYFRFRPNLRDEGDNHVLEIAVASSSTYLVTNNRRDFLGAELAFKGLQIVSPEELVEKLS